MVLIIGCGFDIVTLQRLKKQKLDSADKKIVTELIDDLKKALEGK